MKDIYQLITETVPVFFFTYSPKKKVIEYVSPQFYDFLNQEEEINNLSQHEKLKAIIKEGAKKKFDKFFDDLDEKNNYTSNIELKTKKDKFKIEWLELNTFHPRPSKQSKELLIVGHIIDITQKKKTV